ncbi:NADPH:quinone reductase-like Zn-dependent oxidoreductase [Mucilaginibacter frigoritolerans]|uniref:NADPH:quinone reductase-like Zn-dependent oxidoreductase n=1 Tax=Mucilaginibacter frigoritolerans TaxID=652788 RepID=A0A562U9S3_9SPHI|nr:zinc-binding dehydrogenase [Mucilaginibacter frigoritolerans]TWJ02548.1 NADPH:quinone reductase-like Zn-dependent oxidoreductase [Mucilaginibacter frigoritolerans]
MKAAVLHQLGTAPKYEDFAVPVPQNEDQVLITVKAASVKNLDKGRASGSHYASHTNLPTVVGVDGVGVLEDGTRVYAVGITGMIAEKALIHKGQYTVLPDGVDDATAAALPNAIMGAALAIKYRAQIKAGDTVLINGATGVTGQAAVQIAKYYGAKKVIATGRNPESLKLLTQLGADEVISLKDDDETIIKQIKEIHGNSPISSVIDYTWGHPAEVIINALKGGGLHNITPIVRFVTVGSMAGDEIKVSSNILRSTAIELLGSGFGSVQADAMEKLNSEILPEMLQLSALGRLKIETVTRPLKDVETAWTEHVGAGKRLVIVM